MQTQNPLLMSHKKIRSLNNKHETPSIAMLNNITVLNDLNMKEYRELNQVKYFLHDCGYCLIYNIGVQYMTCFLNII